MATLMDAQIIDIDPGNVEPPFSVGRVYYVYGTDPTDVWTKEKPAHGKRLAMAVQGTCIVELTSGSDRKSFKLDTPNQGLVVGGEVSWELREWSPDCVLTVLAAAA